ncbi:TrmB family transcriptional regulator [Anaerosporobacter faecicola]|uniref:TrmB family transcriptional regulator n=1 Tax=Anaerosporobacter faecicola TaxID=2718714 RepID=UPI001439C4CF|nr:TrmB family transcriptional regulator [Anaerosporobacter faecicola]
MEELITYLCNLHFTRLEAQIYVTLLEGGELTGYQIAKKIHISRSSVYSVLDSMHQRGILLLLPGEPLVYKAENPDTLIPKLKRQFAENADEAQQKLKNIVQDTGQEQFFNIRGFDNVVAKARELLLLAKKEVYMNTDFSLHLFEKEFKELNKRGVRIIVFSFANLNCTGLDIEFYSHYRGECSEGHPTRMMLVSDMNVTLVADAYKDRPEFLGTVTQNSLMVSIISEHIHNDIYLLRLREKKNFVFDDSITIGTMLEKR